MVDATHQEDTNRLSPDWVTSGSNYINDAIERSVLFLDVLRQRGNQQIEITSDPMATVLSFEHQVLIDGRSLPRSINYNLSRIIAPHGVVTDLHKRPVVVIDPRAGQGSGVGGFKPQSEIGDALNAGHPVYFIGFGADPVPGQQFLDVVEGQVRFFERVVELHPDAPRPFAIGNCQAGYQTLMVAILRPDLFGPCMVAGAPMSYWQGVKGKNPMRYAGGLLGGSWLNAMSADVGNGKIDGTALILNFDLLNPAYWLWGKQYEIYSKIDTNAKRYLRFEQWWGDFIALNGDELQFLVDNLFIGDKLARNQIESSNGATFDLRNITSPIIVFTSMADNISPPQQSLGWIMDLYQDVEDVIARERTIVYCLSQVVGHLAIFVSSKVGAKQDKAIVQLVDVIDCLPPGLFEMVLTPRPEGVSIDGFVTGEWIASFEDRTFDDISALGRNSVEDDRAFAAVARISEINLSIYRTFLQPLVRASANASSASLMHALNPLRLSYTLFSDQNPLMTGVESMAANVTATRQPVSADNPFLAIQTQISKQIIDMLEACRIARDDMEEKVFFGIYGSPYLQAMLGIDINTEVRPRPSASEDDIAQQEARMKGYAAQVQTGGFNEALVRAVLYVAKADGAIGQRTALALNVARQNRMDLSLAQFRVLMREQFFVLQLEHDKAIDALALMVTEPATRKDLFFHLYAIVSAGAEPSTAANQRITKLSQILEVTTDGLDMPFMADPCCEIDKPLILSHIGDVETTTQVGIKPLREEIAAGSEQPEPLSHESLA